MNVIVHYVFRSEPIFTYACIYFLFSLEASDSCLTPVVSVYSVIVINANPKLSSLADNVVPLLTKGR
jgi:hypothetical protein